MFVEGKFNEGWVQARLGNFTSSNIWRLCSERGLGETGMTYIRQRVYESISRCPAEQEITTYSTAGGLAEEGPALREYIKQRNIHPKQVVVQKMVLGDDPQFSSTPDGIYCKNPSIDDQEWDVEVWEVKAYGAAKHIEHLECETPLELREINRPLYIQVLDQMINLNCLVGKAILTCPSLPVDKGGLHVIHFNKMYKHPSTNKFPLAEDIAFIKSRKELAVKEFNRIKSKICTLSTK